MTESNKFTANKKYSKNERIFLGGDRPVILLGCVSQTQGLTHLSVAVMDGFVLGLASGIPAERIWELGQRMLDTAAMCTTGWCALTSCLDCDWSKEAMHQKQGMGRPHKMGECDYAMLNSFFFFLIIYKLFLITISSSKFEIHPFLGKTYLFLGKAVCKCSISTEYQY